MKKNRFDLSFNVKQTANLGLVTPTSFLTVVPGDEMKINPQVTIKFAPLVGPVLGLFKMKMASIFVPIKLVWQNFEHYFTGDYGASPVLPYITIDTSTTWAMTDFMRYFAAKTSNQHYENINALIPRSYQKGYFDYFYKDNGAAANANESTYLSKGDGNDTTTSMSVQYDFYSSDYFAKMMTNQFYSTFPTFGGSAFTAEQLATWLTNARNQSILMKVKNNFPDYVKHIFGLTNEEMKGATGRSQLIHYRESLFTFTEIVNTALTATSPLGAPGAIVHLNDNTYATNFKSAEHGYIINIISIEPIPDTFGIRKELLLSNKYAIYNPTYEAQGNEPVTRIQMYRDVVDSDAAMVTGYLPIYNHLRETRDFIGGEFVDSTPSVLVLRRTPAWTSATNIYKILSSEYSYIFASYSIPQIRIFQRYNIDAMRVLRKPLSTIPDISQIIE